MTAKMSSYSVICILLCNLTTKSAAQNDKQLSQSLCGSETMAQLMFLLCSETFYEAVFTMLAMTDLRINWENTHFQTHLLDC